MASTNREAPVDIVPLLERIQAIARNGLNYSKDFDDRERYEQLQNLVAEYYGHALDLPPAVIRERLANDLGHATPKVGAAAAIFDEKERVVLVKRTDDRCLCLPCGWVEANEAPIDTAVRETREECGLIVRATRLVDVNSQKSSATNGLHTLLSIVYLCEPIGGTLGTSHEVLESAYWPIDEVTEWHRNHHELALGALASWREGRD